jgi:hypothetical protein
VTWDLQYDYVTSEISDRFDRTIVVGEGGVVPAWQCLMEKGHLTDMVWSMAFFHCIAVSCPGVPVAGVSMNAS